MLDENITEMVTLSEEDHAAAFKAAVAPNATLDEVTLFLSSFKSNLEYQPRYVLDDVCKAFLGIQEKVADRLKALADSDTYPESTFTLDSFSADLWRYRFQPSAAKFGLTHDGNEDKYFNSNIFAVDHNDYVPAMSDSSSVYAYSETEDYLVALHVFSAQHYYRVTIYTGPKCDRLAVDIFKQFEQNILYPNPYEGKIVRLDQDQISLVSFSIGNLSTYADDVEETVQWGMSVFNPEVVKKLKAKGLSCKNGILLEGPPGSGKTTLIRRMAKELEGRVTTLYISPGTPILDALKFAKNFDKSMVVLEDVESHFGSRGAGSFSNFLNAIDGVDNSQTMLIVATTNDSHDFDPAVLRSGRLEERATIFSIHPNAIYNMFMERFENETPETLTKLVEIAQKRAEKDAGGFLTPAIIDSLARRAIMLNLSGDNLIDYVENKWRLSTHGESFINNDTEYSDRPMSNQEFIDSLIKS